jgi:predicted Fe-Mo cluster-binding NifX family protein
MKIAIAAEDSRGLDGSVSHHFGRCPYFLLVNVEDGKVINVDTIENPFFAGHQPGMVPKFIREQGADVMISGGMGRRAIAFFEEFNISTATGASGTAQETLERYLAGDLQETAPCRDQEHHHSGHHDHGCGEHHD